VGRSQPAIEEVLESHIAGELSALHPTHIARFEAMRVTPRLLPVSNTPGEYVYVVAETQGKVLFYSDMDEAWGLQLQDNLGGITLLTDDLYQLSQLLHQLYGAPNIRTCGG